MEAMYWLIALAVLIVFELATLGLYTIWFAGGAVIAFIAAYLGVGVGLQFVLFFVVSLLLLIFTRPMAVRYMSRKHIKTNYEGLIGKIIKIMERVDNYNQTGTSVVNGQEWTVRSDVDTRILEPGTKAKIVDISGVKLIVTEYREEQ